LRVEPSRSFIARCNACNASLRAGLTLMIYITGRRGLVGNVADNSVSRLKHNSGLTPHPSVIWVELLGQSYQPMTGRLATTLTTQRSRDRCNRLSQAGIVHREAEKRNQFSFVCIFLIVGW